MSALIEIDDQAVLRGDERLEPGVLYTHGRLAFSCVSHEPPARPRLKLKLYPASFVESMAMLKPFDSFMKERSRDPMQLPHAVLKP